MAGLGVLGGLAAVNDGYNKGAEGYWRTRQLESDQAAMEAAAKGWQLLAPQGSMPGAMSMQPPPGPPPVSPTQLQGLKPGQDQPPPQASPQPPMPPGTQFAMGGGAQMPVPTPQPLQGPPPGMVNPRQMGGQPQNLTGPPIAPGGNGPMGPQASAMPGGMPMQPPGGGPPPPAPPGAQPPGQPPGMGGPAPGGPPGGPPGMQRPGMMGQPGMGNGAPDWRQLAQAITQANPGIKPDVFFKAMDSSMKLFNPQVQMQYRLATIEAREQALREKQYEFDTNQARLTSQGEAKTAAGAQKTEQAASNVQQIAKGIINGDQPPTVTGLYGTGPAVRAELEKQGFNLAKAQQEWQGATRQIAALNGPQMTRFTVLASTVDNTIGEVNQLAEQMQLKGIPLANRAELFGYIQAQGDTENSKLAVRYITAVNTLKEEFANLANGGYAPTEPAWKLANEQINGNYSVGKLNASLSEVQRLIKYRVQAIEAKGGMGSNRYAPGGGGQPQPQQGAPEAPVIKYDAQGNRVDANPSPER